MHRSTILVLSSVSLAALLAEGLMSKRLGILPNTTVGTFNVGSLTRTSSRSCGQCHLGAHGAVTVSVAPAARSLGLNQSTAVTISGSSTVPSTTGGFTADLTKGTFVAGTGSRINSAGTAITHSASTSRSWTFNVKAPATPGLMELYTAVNTTNGNLFPTGDRFAFHGSSPANTTSTPVRMFANAAGVTNVGGSCPDSFGNYSVLGASTSPARGQNFVLEGHGMTPAARCLVAFNLGSPIPGGFDLRPLGSPGCMLYSSVQIEFMVATSAGNASRADGRVVLPLPIPSSIPIGTKFTSQLLYLDSSNRVRVTNGLECTVR